MFLVAVQIMFTWFMGVSNLFINFSKWILFSRSLRIQNIIYEETNNKHHMPINGLIIIVLLNYIKK
jgi:hypothetical protein